MNLSWRELIVAAVIAVGAASPVSAQAITVQQPAVGGFSVSTTVSVPDRGSAFLGGVNSAASGRYSSGIFRPGTNSGIDRTGSAMWTSVRIHDLQAMDEALLAGASNRDRVDPWTPRMAERRAALPGAAKSLPRDAGVSDAARYERLARDAEAHGKEAVARLHWKMAAKLGSSTAQQRLTEIAAR